MNDDEENTNQIKIKGYTINSENNLSNLGLDKDYLSFKNKKKYFCKIIPKNIIKQRSEIKRLSDTIKIHLKIDHENIIQMHDYSEDGDFIYLFLKFIEGKTLEKILTGNDSYIFEENEIFIIIEQIVNVLIFLYENNIIIHDLTIKNIYITNNENKDNTIYKYNVFLSNLEDSFLLSHKRKYDFENCYNKIIYKLGLIICKLLDKKFHFFLTNKKIDVDDEQNEDIIKDYIQNKILKTDKLSKYIIKFIINSVIIKDDKMHIKNIKEDKWFKHSYEKIQEKNKNKNKINESFSSSSSSVLSTNQIQEGKSKDKKNVVEETIFTDEGYLEYYEKEKEYRLGIIDDFNGEEILNKIKESNNYMKYKDCEEDEELGNESENTRRTDVENKKSIKENEQRRRRDKSKGSKSLWKCSN